MNDTKIENILSHAPRPGAPPGLLKRLQAGIALPAAKSPGRAREWQNPSRRWFPALAFGVLMLSCDLMIAVQANWSINLKRHNEALRAAAAALPQLREQHAALEQAQAQKDELLQLRKDNVEMRQLQNEVAGLRSLPAQIVRLQNENRRLSAAPATNATTVTAASFFEEAQQQAERIQCVNNLKQLGLAMRIWAGDNGDKYPTSMGVMSNEISALKVLVCPSDKERLSSLPQGWRDFRDNMSSYQYIAQPDDEQFPECIAAYCPIHHNYLLADGSVQQINPEKVYLTQKDGRLYLEAAKPGATYQGTVQKIK